MRLILLAICQSLLLCGSQTLLKFGLMRLQSFSWTWNFWGNLLTNWWMLGAGLGFACSGVLWMYILRHFPFSHAYPLVSMAYVFGMIVAIVVFHESVHWNQWVGVLLIMGGCFMIAQ